MHSNIIGCSKIYPLSVPVLYWLSHLTCISSLRAKTERKTLIFTRLKISRYNQHFFAIFRPILINWPPTYGLYVVWPHWLFCPRSVYPGRSRQHVHCHWPELKVRAQGHRNHTRLTDRQGLDACSHFALSLWYHGPPLESFVSSAAAVPAVTPYVINITPSYGWGKKAWLTHIKLHNPQHEALQERQTKKKHAKFEVSCYFFFVLHTWYGCVHL